ncbi:uncharacterized protein LOC126740254 isoform X2 [Anthonomus grandis grandis]|uniref:uncharacterized protein LOC126740254 isoform X2 n=1 Tax=Anthonomus grandis grandis TaxID=2921223 RepID=UPI002166117F|nr:uncharacterized protein LOC126740254 isoform X2 [Anthonomus grandis grandis]
MGSEEYFNTILQNINRKYEFIDNKWRNNKQYEIKFRTQLLIKNEDYEKQCDQWVEEFSHKTKTVWVHKLSNFGSKVRYRKQYQCWTYDTNEINQEMLFDHRKCKATLDIKVFAPAALPVKTSKFLRLGLNALVKIHFLHLHPVDTTKNQSFFVHRCPPLLEVPKPHPPSNERVTQLVAKVVESAPIISQMAAERAREIMEKQFNDSSPQERILNDPGPNLPHINPETQTDGRVMYIHLFDSVTHTLKEEVKQLYVPI